MAAFRTDFILISILNTRLTKCHGLGRFPGKRKRTSLRSVVRRMDSNISIFTESKVLP